MNPGVSWSRRARLAHPSPPQPPRLLKTLMFLRMWAHIEGGGVQLALLLLWLPHCGHQPPEISHTGQEVGTCPQTTEFQVSMLVGAILNKCPPRDWPSFAATAGDAETKQEKVGGRGRALCFSTTPLQRHLNLTARNTELLMRSL